MLCANPIWRRDWRKTSFLRRSPMPRGQAWQSKQGNPFQPVYRRILANAPFKPDGVRAIPADHDVYPWGDEPSGAMIQTEPPEPKLSKILQDPSSLHNVNRTGRHSGTSPTRLQTFSSSLDDCFASLYRQAAAAEPCGSSVVEPVGIEPTTPCLQSRCSPS